MDATIVICAPYVEKKIVAAVGIAKLTLKHEIKVFILGSSEGIESNSEDILSLLYDTDLDKAPDPVILDSHELDTQRAIIFWTSGTTGISTKRFVNPIP